MQMRAAGILTRIGLLLIAIYSASLHAEQQLCTQHGILIEGNPRDDVIDACTAVKSAAPFFAIAGLSMPKNILIRLVDDSSSPFLDDHEIGHYDGKLHAIVMRDSHTAAAQSMQTEPWQKVLDPRDLWRSYIVHELTHAAIHAACNKRCPSRAIHEYVAAVSQLSALPEQSRFRLLESYHDLEAFERESEITDIYYHINPHYFAVKSYKHYIRLTDPQGFLRSALNPR